MTGVSLDWSVIYLEPPYYVMYFVVLLYLTFWFFDYQNVGKKAEKHLGFLEVSALCYN